MRLRHKHYLHPTKTKKRLRLLPVGLGISCALVILFALATRGNNASAPHTLPSHQQAVAHTSKPPAAAPASSNDTLNRGLPVKLQIEKLGITAKILYVGTAKDGSMGTPPNVTDTAWYKHGALPGNDGTAVIAGHLDGEDGKPGVFTNLHTLAPGDTVKVTDSNGRVASFAVRTTKSYGKSEQPAEVFTSSSGAHLNLITCGGKWNRSEQQFQERLVIFTEAAGPYR